ncbi:hypothetical protein [Mycobacterium sp. SMC-4]|uniref:hypothetical protein n=1 Tax=Mycobacterium sp. SMC-4 TaxID=2857059 RepID=UPI003CFF7766
MGLDPKGLAVSVTKVAPGARRLPDEIESEILKYSPIATIRTADAAVQFFKTQLGTDVSKYGIVTAVANREVEHVKRAGSLYFSPRALVRWLMEGLRTEESA